MDSWRFSFGVFKPTGQSEPSPLKSINQTSFKPFPYRDDSGSEKILKNVSITVHMLSNNLQTTM